MTASKGFEAWLRTARTATSAGGISLGTAADDHGRRTRRPLHLRTMEDDDAMKAIGQPVGVLFPALVGPEPAPRFRFIDLFAGIGGIRIGLERAGGRCVYTVEFDRFAMRTYSANFGRVGPYGQRRQEAPVDIYDVDVADLPPYDVLAAGFPCQPFSIAGVSTASRTRSREMSSSRSRV